MSLECSECERDARGGHDPSCSRFRGDVVVDDGTRWGYAESDMAESYKGAFTSREACIEAALKDPDFADVPIWICKGKKVSAVEAICSIAWVEDILERMEEHAADEYGAEDEVFRLRPGAREALERLLARWAADCIEESGWWCCTEEPEKVR